MNKEEIKEKLKVFDDFKFFDSDHHYEFKGKRVGMSVTRLIEEYANDFKQDEIADKVVDKNIAIRNKKLADPMATFDEIQQALSLPITRQDVLKEWEYKNNFACEKGSTCHEFAQSLWSDKPFLASEFDGGEKFKNAVDKIKQQAINFYDDYKAFLQHFADEFIIGSEEFDIASAIDHLFINRHTGGLVLVDYKTNSYLTGHNKKSYPKKMKPPLNNLIDDSLHHYYLQLSIYKYLVELYSGIEIAEMFIVYMSENIKNYEIIEIPYLKNEVQKILNNRRVKNMNSVPILLIGKSGTGKSTSLRNFKAEDVAIVNVLGKPLPFKSKLNAPKCDDYNVILKSIAATNKKTIVIDDANYLITNEFMNKSSVKGYDKYNEIANNFFNLINGIKNIEGGKTVYLIMHEDVDDEGNIKPKTIGKLLDDKINIQGMFTVCIRSVYDDGKYLFRLKTNGQDCVKTPFEMFDDDVMENDLKAFDDVVRDYYELDKKEEKKEGNE